MESTKPNRIQLPPISSLTDNIQLIPLFNDSPEVPIPTPASFKPPDFQLNQPHQFSPPSLDNHGNINSNDNNNNDDVSGQYKLSDDLQILKAIKTYYGNAFSGSVPWSFWQTYIKTTNCNRSSSSLYHHWNGSMQRKYGTYLKQKRVDECIEWIQKEMKSLNPSKRKCMKEADPPHIQPTGQPLCHNWSAPVAYFGQGSNFNFPIGGISPQKVQYPPFY
ncbi:hypothetical protein TRFO_16682 [Tritrichomonas foetus]|uniref:Uncharacterized protein n=1 Tax=Tritrichomonas foetus TaxID=1144522 RepID=A0A1J4KUR2_9EUKA|nr:hypothetical protein TRFO_16682 [Tritrichomonas foetus]|eukprot:OHT13237.1 hypothetical protein TRFO_16682 [Tritrichomonas foetus]